jgi:hypothetical protein
MPKFIYDVRNKCNKKIFFARGSKDGRWEAEKIGRWEKEVIRGE